MADQTIRFDDGAAYEKYMGVWSQLAGEFFLKWLAPGRSLRWVDIGCGNGAFTELIAQHCSPISIQGVDPSEGQLAYARTRSASRIAEFRKGDALALPFREDEFDVAVMALVLVFVPDPARGLAEMCRVVRPGGTVAAYMWDMVGGGFPLDPIIEEMRAMGFAPQRPPRMDASSLATMETLWRQAGLETVESRSITVSRTFSDFDSLWITNTAAASLASTIANLSGTDLDALRDRLRSRLPPDEHGRIMYQARANAVKGRVPI